MSSNFLHPRGNFVSSGRPPGDKFCTARIAFVPYRQPPLSQKILIVQPQFFETRPRHIRKLQFGLLGSSAGLAALGDVLHPAPRCLNHLVMGPAATFDVAVAETHRDVIHQLCDLEALQLAIAAVFGNQLVISHRSHHDMCQTLTARSPSSRSGSPRTSRARRGPRHASREARRSRSCSDAPCIQATTCPSLRTHSTPGRP